MDKKIIIFLSIFFIIVFFANSVLAFNWNDGSLVSYYKLDETSGNTVYDATGNNNGIIVGSGYVLGQTGIITNDTAYNFLGTNSYVSITTIPIVNFGSGNFTITSWVKTNTSSVVNQQFIGQSSTNLLTPYFGFTLRSYNFQNSNNPSGAIDFHINTMYTDADIISMVPINDDSWHFLVGEKINNATGNFTVLYLDGNLIGATIINGITGPAIESYNNNIFAIGGNAGSSTGPIFFYGTIDEVGIWNRSLSSSEIQQLYNSGKGLNPNILPPRILISSISPSDNYYSSSLNMTTLGLITSYNNSIKNVTLILDGGENQVNSSGFNNTFYSF